jgi:hypothetical protein
VCHLLQLGSYQCLLRVGSLFFASFHATNIELLQLQFEERLQVLSTAASEIVFASFLISDVQK